MTDARKTKAKTRTRRASAPKPPPTFDQEAAMAGLVRGLDQLSYFLNLMVPPDGIEHCRKVCTQRLQDDKDGKDTDFIVEMARNGVAGADVVLCVLAMKAKEAGQFEQLRQSVRDFARWRIPFFDNPR